MSLFFGVFTIFLVVFVAFLFLGTDVSWILLKNKDDKKKEQAQEEE